MGIFRFPTPASKKFTWSGVFAVILIALGGITLTLKGVDIFGLVAAATSSLTQAPVTLYLTPYSDEDLHIGETKKIDVSVNARVRINAIGATITFPQESVEVLGFSKEKSFFDLWTEETAIKEDMGEVHFSGGTIQSGGMMGTGTVLTLVLRAKKSGEVRLSFKDSQVFSSDGKGTEIDNNVRTLAFTVQPRTVAGNTSASTNIVTIAQPEKPLPKSADLNGDGLVNLIDMSIMILHLMMAPYDQRYDLNMDGTVNISDLSILLSQVH